MGAADVAKTATPTRQGTRTVDRAAHPVTYNVGGAGGVLIRVSFEVCGLLRGILRLALLAFPLGLTRYVWPLFPILVFGFLNGARLLVSRVRSFRQKDCAAAVSLMIAILAATGALAQHEFEPSRESLVEKESAERLFEYLRSRHESEQLRVAFPKPRVLT